MATNKQPWRVVRLRRKQLHDISTKRIVFAQLYTLVVAAFIGYYLNAGKELFVLVGGTLVLYPGLSDLTSSNATSLSIHIHHDLDASPEKSKLSIYLKNFFVAMLITVIAGAVIGTIAGLISDILFATVFWKILVLSITAASIIGLVGYPLIMLATVILRQRGLNPDDVIAPIESSIIGSVSVIVILIMSGVIG